MPSIKISSLPVGAADPNAILIINNAGNTQTQRVTAGAIAALSGPVHSVAGRTGAVAITSADISNFNTAVAVVAGTASPVVSVNGATGAVSLNATTIGAAPASHSHNSTAVTDFVTAVATGERWTTVTISNSVISTVADVYRLTSSTNTELRGITNAVRDGSTRATFVNVGVNNVTFVHNHSTDSAAFLCPGGVNFALGENQWAHGRYDPTSQRWRVVPNCCGGT
ncbi:hypothetical protein EBZ80_17880 [bacterium]|nr:hypothetical protein [bacterium]